MLCRAIPYEGTEPYIFFSYSHKDADRVYPLLEQMVRDGYRVWYDDGNHPGDDWLENIGHHLNNCHLCLAMMSQNAEQSHNCKKEVSFAVQCGKKLMAVMLEQFTMTVGMRLQLSTIHYLVKTEYPSDKALLEKLYETESMKDCRTKPGSLPMRTIAASPTETKEESDQKPAVQAFVNSEVVHKAEPDVPVVSAEPDHDQVPQEETPVPVEKKKPARKVRTKVKAVKVVDKREPKAVSESPEPVSQSVKPAAPEAEELAVPVEEVPAVSAEEQKPIQVETKKEMPVASENASETPEINKATPKPEVVHTSMPDASAQQSAGPQYNALLLRLADGSNYTLDKDFVRVGRSEKRCDVALKNNHLISNHHANIIAESGNYYLQDAGSSNGTFVNGERLQPDSRVQLENAAKFRLSNEDFMLVYGPEVKVCRKNRAVAYLCNPNTKSVRVVADEPLLLDRLHKWSDGSLSNGNISRKHARICWEKGTYYLEDLGSKNGTYYNEQRLPQKARQSLKSGDQIRLVDTVLEFNLVTF